jgi:hypothetical protein
MKKILIILSTIVGGIVAFLTANAGLIKKKNKEIEGLKEEKKDFELKEAILIDNAKDAKKKTIKSKEALEDEKKKVEKTYGVNFNSRDDLIKFIASGERKS